MPNENQKLVQDFGKAIAEFMLAKARGAIDLAPYRDKVNEIELQILSRMKTREPL